MYRKGSGPNIFIGKAVDLIYIYRKGSGPNIFIGKAVDLIY